MHLHLIGYYIKLYRSSINFNSNRCGIERTGHQRCYVSTVQTIKSSDLLFISSYVVNYDFPNHIEDYVHRVGRTGRAGYVKKGVL